MVAVLPAAAVAAAAADGSRFRVRRASRRAPATLVRKWSGRTSLPVSLSLSLFIHLMPVVVQALRGEAGPHVEPELGQRVDRVLVEEVAFGGRKRDRENEGEG